MYQRRFVRGEVLDGRTKNLVHAFFIQLPIARTARPRGKGYYLVPKDLSKLLAQITKAQGVGSLVRLGDRENLPVDVVSTGVLSLDLALGVGGFPRGRVIEIYGPESGGKTTLALQAIAEVQKLDEAAAFIDAEHAFDTAYASQLGVDVDNLLISQPDNGEQALEIAEALIKSGDVGIVVVDSVAALVPKAELEGEMGDAQMGLQARLMSQALRKLTGVVSKSNTILIFINQLREKIGVMFGSPETTTGGRSLKFYASVRLDVRRISTTKIDEVATSNRVKIKVVKNKVSSPFREVETDLVFGLGFSKESDILDLSLKHGLVEKSGAWLVYGEEKFQGRENFRQYLKDNVQKMDELEQKIRDANKPS